MDFGASFHYPSFLLWNKSQPRGELRRVIVRFSLLMVQIRGLVLSFLSRVSLLQLIMTGPAHLHHCNHAPVLSAKHACHDLRRTAFIVSIKGAFGPFIFRLSDELLRGFCLRGLHHQGEQESRMTRIVGERRERHHRVGLGIMTDIPVDRAYTYLALNSKLVNRRTHDSGILD